jgi:alpha-L-fucosidase
MNFKSYFLFSLFIIGALSPSFGKKSPSPLQIPEAKSVVKNGAPKPLEVLQQEFLDLRFGMFIHFNIPTYGGHDWPDPQLSPTVFNPQKLDCNQWADAAVSAGMTYGCLTTKHHSGFCIWPTKTTGYNLMNSPFKRDVVREYADAFRKKGLKVFLYYSILDTHHNIRPGWIKKENTQLIKDQLTELLSNYGEIACLVIDGWDAGWSRISYDDVPFEEIYKLVKSLQPNCLISEHNAGKYPADELFYTDVKHYEQNAGQKISKETNNLPAQAGIPININWFWKETSPAEIVKKAKYIVEDNLIPLNEAHCNFILNVAPNRDGLIDENAMAELREVGKLWKNPGLAAKLPFYKQPVIVSNLAKKQKMNSSWSADMDISDFANDDNFVTKWSSSPTVSNPYLEIEFDKVTTFNAIGIVELAKGRNSPGDGKTRIFSYNLQYRDGESWKNIEIQESNDLIRIHRFKPVQSDKVRLQVNGCKPGLAIAELMVYNEK